MWTPRVIATWDGRDAGWQPALRGGVGGRELGPLIRALRAPAVAAGLDERGWCGGRRWRFVWR